MLEKDFMLKLAALFLMMTISRLTHAESPCDVRPGTSVGIKVLEFATGNVIHSKMPIKEGSPEALLEEMISLQDMGICEERIIAQKCVLKFEKQKQLNFVSLYRGTFRWNTWNLKQKNHAQNYVKNLKKLGFCS
jgi:hypothetical protein